MFDITVQLSDQLLNYITGTIYIEIDHEPAQPPPVLIQLNGIQYSYTDRYVLFIVTHNAIYSNTIIMLFMVTLQEQNLIIIINYFLGYILLQIVHCQGWLWLVCQGLKDTLMLCPLHKLKEIT